MARRFALKLTAVVAALAWAGAAYAQTIPQLPAATQSNSTDLYQCSQGPGNSTNITRKCTLSQMLVNTITTANTPRIVLTLEQFSTVSHPCYVSSSYTGGPDCSYAFAAMEAYRTGLSPQNGTVQVEEDFGRGFYNFNSTPPEWDIQQNTSLFIHGAGPMLDGTRFIANSGITSCGNGFARILGGGSAAGMAFDVEGITFVQNGSACTTGFSIQNVQASVQYNKISHVYVNNFIYDWLFQHSRLIHLEDWSAWSPGVANAVGMTWAEPTGAPGTGDSQIGPGEIVLGSAGGTTMTGATGILITTSTASGGLVSGLRFSGVIVEFADTALDINCGVASGGISDLWFTGGTQFDGSTIRAVRDRSTVATCQTFDHHYEGLYATAYNANPTQPGNQFSATQAGDSYDFFLNDIQWANFSAPFILNYIANFHMTDNNFHGFGRTDGTTIAEIIAATSLTSSNVTNSSYTTIGTVSAFLVSNTTGVTVTGWQPGALGVSGAISPATCSGSPTSSFATVNGVITHC